MLKGSTARAVKASFAPGFRLLLKVLASSSLARTGYGVHYSMKISDLKDTAVTPGYKMLNLMAIAKMGVKQGPFDMIRDIRRYFAAAVATTAKL